MILLLDEDEDSDLDDEEMEYYEDSEGNLVLAPAGRMKQHKSLMENRSSEEEDEDSEEEEGKF